QNGHRDDGEVLDERDADHHAAVAGVQLAAVHEKPHEHHGAGHGDDEADGEPLPGRPAEHAPGAGAQRGRQQDAQRSAEQRDPPDAQQVAQRELDADREQQQDDADLGEQLDGVGVGHGGARRETPDEDAAHDVPEDQGLAREPRQRATGYGGDDHPGEVAEEI